jgi:hypothetical protein
MRKVSVLFALLAIALVSQAQTDETTLFPESINPGDYRPTEVRLPASPLSMQVLFIGGYDTVQTRSGEAIAKQWHDFIGFTPDTVTGTSDLGWVSVNHEMILADDKIGDGGGMTAFKVARITDDSLAIVPQALSDGRVGKFFNVQFENVGETGMNCAGITSLADGRIWTAEEWFRTSTNSYYDNGNGIRDTSDFTISGSGIAGFDGVTINKIDNLNYMVEIDPREAEAIRKQYNWGRGGWEGGVIMPDNQTVYLGEDARPGLFTRFIANTPGDFTNGTYSYYGYDEATETGYWVDYPINNIVDAANLSASNPLSSPSANTITGAAFVGPDAAAMFIRNEWVASTGGKVYWSETGNTGFWNEFTDFRLHQSSPVSIADYDGNGYNGKIGSWHLEAARMRYPFLNTVSNDSVREWLTAGPNFIDAHGRVLCYDPATEQTTIFLEGGPYPGDANSTSASVANGYPEKHLSNPDGLNFITTPQGKTFMIIQEDLNQSSYNSVPADALGNNTCEMWALDMDVANPTVDDLIRITQVPLGAEVTGAQATSDGKTLLLNAQHPAGSNPFPYNNSLTIAIHGWDKLAELAERRVAGLALYDANADTLIKMIKSGDVVEVADLEDRRLAFKAVMEPMSIDGSVAIEVSGGYDAYRVENNAPYSAFGKSSGVLTGKKIRAGAYEVLITPNDAANRSGNDGIARKYAFELVNSTAAIATFKLWDGLADTVITDLSNGQVVEIADLENRYLNIIAEPVAGSGVESVRLRLFGLGKGNRKDSDEPYTQFKKLKGKKFDAGMYTIYAQPYSQDNGQGTELASASIDFTLAEAGAQGNGPALSLVPATEADNGFMVFPNPTVESLNFNKQVSVAIYNELGQRIAVYNDVKQINVNDFRHKISGSNTFFVLPANGEKAVRVVLSNN